MDASNVTGAIPFTAWEQAVFVALFIVMVIALLTWFTKQSEKWQKFIAEIDDKWREFNREQRIENNDAMTEVNQSITNLTAVTQGMVAEVKQMREESAKFYENFHEHDQQAAEILRAVKPRRNDTRNPAK